MQLRQKTSRIKDLHAKLFEIAVYFDDFCRNNNIQYYLLAGSTLGAIRHRGFVPWDDDFDVGMTIDNYDKFLKLAANIDKDKYFVQVENSDGWPLMFTKIRMNGTTFLEDGWEKSVSSHHGIFMDVFCLYYAPQSLIERYTQFIIAKLIVAKALYERGNYVTSSKRKKIIIQIARIIVSKHTKNKLIRWVKLKGRKESKFFWLLFDKFYKKALYPKEYFGTPRYVEFLTTTFPIPEKAEAYLTYTYGDYMKLPDEKKRIKDVHAHYFDLEIDYKEFINKL